MKAGLLALEKKLRALEQNLEQGLAPSAEALEYLKADLLSFRHETDPFLHHLADLTKHLHMALTLKELYNLSVPVERALQRNLRDDQFLTTTRDLDPDTNRTTYPISLVVENLRSAFNVGSLFRTGDGLGVEKIYLAGYTPTPDQELLGKTALGAQQNLPWSHEPHLENLIQSLKQKSIRLMALETSPTALEISQPFQLIPSAFILGNERFGLSPATLELCDEVRFIPMAGRKNSLNVGVAAGLALYEWTLQWKASLTK